VSGLGEFLRNRRERLRPEQVGLPTGPGRRQTPGLRREELAALAGVSVDYYIRLERGRDTHPSDAVLDALATALRLDDDERAHLRGLGLARPGRLGRPPSASAPRAALAPRPDAARAGLVRLLEWVRPTPAYVLSPTSALLAANQEGLLLLAGIADWPPAERNLIRYVFVHPLARRVFASWPGMAEDCVAHLRNVPADDPPLIELVTELTQASAEFTRLWRHYDVRVKRGTRRAFNHPSVGPLELTSEILTAVDGQRFVTFQADAGSPSQDALALLAPAAGLEAGTAREQRSP
jgi:transcriptional regulator with XRE-family HTH domain